MQMAPAKPQFIYEYRCKLTRTDGNGRCGHLLTRGSREIKDPQEMFCTKCRRKPIVPTQAFLAIVRFAT